MLALSDRRCLRSLHLFPTCCRGTNLILSGAYADFSPSWYVDVGQSLQLLIIINAVLTGGCQMWLLMELQWGWSSTMCHAVGLQRNACLQLGPHVVTSANATGCLSVSCAFKIRLLLLLRALACRCICMGHVGPAQAEAVHADHLADQCQPVGLECSLDWHGLCPGCQVGVNTGCQGLSETLIVVHMQS